MKPPFLWVAFAALIGCSTSSGDSSNGHGGGGHGGAGQGVGGASGGGASNQGGASCVPSGPTVPLGCPVTSIPNDNRFCSATECFGPDEDACDTGCPTKARAWCFGTCTTREKADAECHSGTWTCLAGGKAVSTCCTDSCLDPSCCFPSACGPSDGAAVGVGVSAGAGGAGAGGGGGSGGAAMAHGSSTCGAHTLGASCDDAGNCSCSLDGHKVGTCKDDRSVDTAANPAAGCCGAYFTSC